MTRERWVAQAKKNAKSITELGALVVKEARPGYGGPERLERVRQAVGEGLPVEAVKELQVELKRFGVRREIGRAWAASQGSVALFVPSFVAQPWGWNVVINPDHPEFERVVAAETVDVPWDPRVI